MARQTQANKKKADKVLGRRDASREWLSKNFYDDFEDVWRAYKVRNGLRPPRPRLLRAGVHAGLLKQQHRRLQVHSQVRPLRRTHDPVYKAKHGRGGAEEPLIVLEPLEALGPLVPANAEERVHVFTHLKTGGAVRFL